MSNPGCALDSGWINSVQVNTWCALEAVKDIPKYQRSLHGNYRAAWLLKAVSCIDLTTLAGDDSCSNVLRLCSKAGNPISENTLYELGFEQRPFTTAAVCVYPARVSEAVDGIKQMKELQLPVAAVATGFPSGQYKLPSRIMEIGDCLDAGASEIDVVIDRSLVLSGRWNKLYSELKEMKVMEACGSAKLKTILSVGELGSLRNVYKASLVAMMAGSDFIKTSTGKEAVNATLPTGLVMMQAITEYYNATTYKVGFKAAGGIRTASDALNWLALVKSQLGSEWLNNSLFRIGASSLLRDVEEELYFLAFGCFPAREEFTLG